MKAVYFEQHGELDVLRYGDVPDPELTAGQAVVRVRACALNYLDIWVRRGWPGLKLPMPHWCGADVAGEILALGPGVTGWSIGQRVVVDPGISLVEDEFTRRGECSVSPGYHIIGEHLRGGAAEVISVPAGNLAVLPDGMGFSEAAAPLLVGLTAWRMLIHRAGLQAGESVLVVGSGGGVNSMAIQIAKLAGAFVFVVASNADKAEKAKALGADVVVDRSAADWVREVLKLTGKRGVDVVVDNVGCATLMQHQRPEGRNRHPLHLRQTDQRDRQHHGQSPGFSPGARSARSGPAEARNRPRRAPRRGDRCLSCDGGRRVLRENSARAVSAITGSVA
jgi:NADPH:quinone reductase-like Zn-dependent oxidoreductase